MADLKVISRFIGLLSVLTTALFALRRRRTGGRGSQVEALGRRSAFAPRGSDNEKQNVTPGWPPPDGVYWGM